MCVCVCVCVCVATLYVDVIPTWIVGTCMVSAINLNVFRQSLEDQLDVFNIMLCRKIAREQVGCCQSDLFTQISYAHVCTCVCMYVHAYMYMYVSDLRPLVVYRTL